MRWRFRRTAPLVALLACDPTAPVPDRAGWFTSRRWRIDALCGCPLPYGCFRSLATRGDSSLVVGTLDSLAVFRREPPNTPPGDTVIVLLERGTITLVEYRSNINGNGTISPAPALIRTYSGAQASGQLVFYVPAPDTAIGAGYVFARASGTRRPLTPVPSPSEYACLMSPGRPPILEEQ